MRLFEISGDDEAIVFEQLSQILRVIRIYKNYENPPIEITTSYYTAIGLLSNDPLNLTYWIHASQRIASIYNKIQTLKGT